MFYNTEMLTKRGPLARVWMASHLTTKLSKSHLLATSIPSSVGSILGEALLPMALRLSGQLLLGVARIYSRKAKYLLDDCNDTLVKVKRAFRPGAVDLEEVEGRGRETITMRAEQGGLDDILNNDAGLNYWDMDFAGGAVAGPSRAKNARANTSTNAEISLPDNAYANYSQFDYNDGTGLGSQDFDPFGGFDEGFELGILEEDDLMVDMTPGDGLFDAADPKGKKRARSDGGESDEGSIEAGRDAQGSVGHASARGSLGGPDLDALDDQGDVTMQSGLGGHFDLEKAPFGDMGGMEEGDFNFDLGDFGDMDRMRTPQAATQDEDALAVTPKTAADLAKVAKGAKRAKVVKKQVVDSVTELEWESGARAAQKENLFVEPQFLPRSRLHLRLLEVSNSATSVYLPKPTDPKGNSFNIAPPGLAPELQELFEFSSRRSRIAADAGRKRDHVQDDEVEAGRFVMDAPDMSFADDGQDVFGDIDDNNAPQDDSGGFQFDLGDDGMPIRADEEFEGNFAGKPRASQANKRQKLSQDGRSSPFLEEDFDLVHSESYGPLAVFDDAPSTAAHASETQSAAPGTQRESLGETEEDNLLANGTTVDTSAKWSRNTVKAINVIQAELKKDDEVVFAKVADKASRRAAASFFFELLVLSTRECITLSQSAAYGDISIGAQDKLYEGALEAAIEA